MKLRSIWLCFLFRIHGLAVRRLRERDAQGTMKIVVLVGEPRLGIWPCAITVYPDEYKIEFPNSGETVRTAREVFYIVHGNI